MSLAILGFGMIWHCRGWKPLLRW